MVAERWQGDAAEAAVLEGGEAAWERLHERIAHRFGRAELRARVRRYLAGLLGRVERKNGWQVAEAIGELGPQGVQRLLTGSAWDADSVRDDLRAYVLEHLGDAASGVLIVDESGFPKKGAHSCGVAPQYCGTLGRSANAQVGVFLAYGSERGAAFVDRALYLPRAWTKDRGRCAAAGVPSGVGLATKVTLAKRLLEQAFAAGVPAGWVVADCLYGRAHHFRAWLEGQGQPHVVGVLPDQVVVCEGRRQRAEALAASLPATAWVRRSAGVGSQGERVHDWLCAPLDEAAPAGMGRWLLVRRPLDAPEDCAYFRAYGPAATTVEELVRVAGARWAVEEALAQAKGEVGLDQYEVRRWEAWHRSVTLCLLAHAYLAAVCAAARASGAPEQRGQEARAPRPLVAVSVPETRRLLLALGEDDDRRAFRLGWSRWRRAHQAVAQRCHVARRARALAAHPEPRALPAAAPGELTDAEWERARPLLPPQRPPVGRRNHDHRAVLSGILWVLRTPAPWREMPACYGKWNTAFVRYRLWRRQGLWPRLIDALGPAAPLLPRQASSDAAA
jgi:SRSO17 transposase/transposase